MRYAAHNASISGFRSARPRPAHPTVCVQSALPNLTKLATDQDATISFYLLGQHNEYVAGGLPQKQ